MPGITPEEMQALQEKAGVKQESIIDTAKSVGAGLSKLGQALEKSPGATPEEKQQMAQILSMYEDLVERKLGGEPEPEKETMPGAVPMEAGVSGIPVNMNMRS